MIDGTVIARLRYDRGMSQRRLAKASGVDGNTVMRLENGSDGSELPLRVVVKMADALGVSVEALLVRTSHGAPTEDASAAGAVLLEHGRLPLPVLARAAGLAPGQVDALLDELGCRLEGTGIGLARGAGEVALVPDRPPVTTTDSVVLGELDANQAKLLRRIHRDEDVRRTMTSAERELTLPSLLRCGLLQVNASRIALSPVARRCLEALAGSASDSDGAVGGHGESS